MSKQRWIISVAVGMGVVIAMVFLFVNPGIKISVQAVPAATEILSGVRDRNIVFHPRWVRFLGNTSGRVVSASELTWQADPAAGGAVHFDFLQLLDMRTAVLRFSAAATADDVALRVALISAEGIPLPAHTVIIGRQPREIVVGGRQFPRHPEKKQIAGMCWEVCNSSAKSLPEPVITLNAMAISQPYEYKLVTKKIF